MNFASILPLLLGSSTNRRPEISMNFCHGFVEAPGRAAGLSTLETAVVLLCDHTSQYTPATSATNPAVQMIVSTHVGSPAAPDCGGGCDVANNVDIGGAVRSGGAADTA